MTKNHYNTWVILLLALLILLIYASVFNAPFHFDDKVLLLQNPYIRSFTDLFAGLGPSARKYLTFFTFAINFHINPYAPGWYRLVNVLCHWLTAVFLVSALRYLFQAPFFRRQKFPHLSWLAWSAALIFCVHPLQTDSVTYIWQRTEVLSGLFYALILMCYWRGRVQKNRRFIVFSACFFVIGMYAKGTVMTAPLLIGLSEFMFFDFGTWIARKPWKRGGLIIFMLTAVILCAGILDLIFFNLNFKGNWRYFFTQCLVIWKYFRLTIFPVGQSVDHGFTWMRTFWNPKVMAGFFGMSGLFALIAYFSRKYRVACFGAAWFFIYLIPTSSFMPIASPIFEHRLYFSLAGFGLLLADIILRVTRHNRKRYWIVMAGVICAFSLLAAARNQTWRSHIVLMEDAVRKAPDFARPRFTLGGYYLSQGRLDEAEQMFRKAVELDPKFSDAYNNLGVVFDRQGRHDEAREFYLKSIQADPLLVDPYLNLSRYYYSSGRPDFAWQWISRVLSRIPDHRVYAYAAFLKIEQGDFYSAKKFLAKGFSRHHSSAQLLYSLGLWHLHQNNLENAAAILKSAVNFSPMWFSPVNDLGVVYFMLKKYDLAKDALERAHHLRPRDASVYLNLANVYYELGEYQMAEQYYKTSRYEKLLPYLPANFDGRDILFLNHSETE